MEYALNYRGLSGQWERDAAQIYTLYLCFSCFCSTSMRYYDVLAHFFGQIVPVLHCTVSLKEAFGQKDMTHHKKTVASTQKISS